MSRILTVALLLAASSLAQGQNDPRVRPRRIYYPYYPPGAPRPLIIHGNNPRVRVQLQPRFDWAFTQTEAAIAATPKTVFLHDSTQTFYHLWVPRTYLHALPHPAIIFVPSKAVPDPFPAFDRLCHKFGVLFAVAYQGNEDVHPSKRMQLTLDVLDDLRRRMAIDTDRVYIAGFGDGARTACELAFAYPEFLGGVLALSGAGSPRSEPWMRERMKERLSIAMVTGEFDLRRREMEVLRHPVLRDLGAKVRLTTVPRQGHAMPVAPILEDAFVWLEMNRMARRLLGFNTPMARMAEGAMPSADLWGRGLLDEANARLRHPPQRDVGLLQLEGIVRRWSGTDVARQAAKRLDKYDETAKEKWRSVYDRKQLQFVYLEAKALEEYLAGPLPPIDLLRKPVILAELATLWELVEQHGPETDQGREAAKRLTELRKLLPGR